MAATTEVADAPHAAKSSAPQPAEQRVVLHNISWETFERLLAELGDNRNCRLAYDKGTLEITSPLGQHERASTLLGLFIPILVEEHGLNLASFGSLTCKREVLARGLEPDKCFYIQNEPRMRAKFDVNLDTEPAPDLMIEVDISNSSIPKLPIYAALKVPEVWRYDGRTLEILLLKDSQYTKHARSPLFPAITPSEMLKFFDLMQHKGELGMLKAFREWVRKQIVEKR